MRAEVDGRWYEDDTIRANKVMVGLARTEGGQPHAAVLMFEVPGELTGQPAAQVSAVVNHEEVIGIMRALGAALDVIAREGG